MPAISLRELLVVALVLLVVLKPEQWPGFLRHVGRAYGRVSGWLQQWRDRSRQAVDDLDHPRD